MKKHGVRLIVVLGWLALLALGCAQQQPAPDTRAADEAAIREADLAWSKTAEARNLDEHNAYFLQDAVVLPPNEPMSAGKDSIRSLVGAYFATPGFSIKWQPTKVEVARSGDLGYSMGTYEATMPDAKGNAVADRGKYTTVWKKQPDGSWKVAVDIFNSDQPMPAPATP